MALPLRRAVATGAYDILHRDAVGDLSLAQLTAGQAAA
jgi:hypothetical protein